MKKIKNIILGTLAVLVIGSILAFSLFWGVIQMIRDWKIATGDLDTPSSEVVNE